MSKRVLVSHSEVANLEVRRAFSSWGKAGRVVSGLLKAAAKRKQIEMRSSWSRVAGYFVWYEMSEEVLGEIRREAISRGDARNK
jgi:hypothetical protein